MCSTIGSAAGFPPTVQRDMQVGGDSHCTVCKRVCESVIVWRLISVTDPGWIHWTWSKESWTRQQQQSNY